MVTAYTVPTEQPQSDGTLDWDQATAVVAEAYAGSTTGLGVTYSTVAAAHLAADMLAPLVVGQPACDMPRLTAAMVRAVRNVGRAGDRVDGVPRQDLRAEVVMRVAAG